MAHKVMIDEPVEAGCQALVFKSFAKAKDLPYESLKIEVEGDVDV